MTDHGMFDLLNNDHVKIRTRSGETLGPFSCVFQPTSVRIREPKLVVAVGDHVLRELPNGTVEEYEIREAHFSKGAGGGLIPPSWKLTIAPMPREPPSFLGQRGPVAVAAPRDAGSTYQVRVEQPEVFPSTGDFEHFGLVFSACPLDRVGTPTEAEHTRQFRVAIKVSGTLISRGSWRDYKRPDLFKHLVAFAQEFLDKELEQAIRSGSVELAIGSHSQNGRFLNGSPYTLANIQSTVLIKAPTVSGDNALYPQEDRVSVSPKAPVAFMSYSHDSEAHKAWVRTLAEKLRVAGVDVLFDQWQGIGTELNHFMENGIRKADRVLIVSTPTYVKKANERTGGAGYESMIVTSHIAKDITTTKFAALLRAGSFSDLPAFLGSRIAVDFRTDSEFDTKLEELVRDIHNTRRHVPPPIGTNPYSGATGHATPP